MTVQAISPEKIYSITKGMPLEVWIDKYSRAKPDGSYQSWEERITEVVDGNFSLDTKNDLGTDHERALTLGKKGIIVTSGRHLQHGDMDQANKIGEYFTNCSTSLFSWIQFLLLMKGSGVGRSYDSDIHYTNWDFMPNVRFVLSSSHADYQPWIESLEEAHHKYDSESSNVRWFTVEDTAEGWVKIITVLETATYHENNKDHLFIFDLSQIRKKGSPIKGQQGRPASGPVPLIEALLKIASIKGAGYKPWKQAMFVDHYLAACVVLGGVRRSSRICTKYWKDRDIFEYIDIKRGGWLYSANNSIGVDAEFWEQALSPAPSHGRRVFEAAMSAAYFDKTGEPAFINFDKLVWKTDGQEAITAQNYIPQQYADMFGGIHAKTYEMMDYILKKAKSKKYPFTLNPCGEETLANYGGYCDVGDVCISNADTQEEAIEAVGLMGKMLVRVNTMPFLYKAETDRTNRIGTSLIGIHECAAKLFNYDFYDMLDEEKSLDWWKFVEQMSIENETQANSYSELLGRVHPHTNNSLKPAGTVAKVFDVTEAANLPSMPVYLRWMQFREDHPLLEEYKRRGYPVRDISKDEVRTDENGKEYTVKGYSRTCIVGFPKKLPIVDILGDRTVCSGDITLDQHFKWLSLLEKYWLREGKGAQISYTIKYDPDKVKYDEFRESILACQPHIRCCSFSPQIKQMAYIYTPEEPITLEEYNALMADIDAAERESVDEASLDCAGGSCGIDFSKNKSIADQTLETLQAAE